MNIFDVLNEVSDGSFLANHRYFHEAFSKASTLEVETLLQERSEAFRSVNVLCFLDDTDLFTHPTTKAFASLDAAQFLLILCSCQNLCLCTLLRIGGKEVTDGQGQDAVEAS